MSTNYYMFTRRKELVPFFGSKVESVDEPDFGYMIHIAKTSHYWPPIFEAHNHIRSVADLKLLYEKGGVQIFDEYNRELFWDEFVKEVVNWDDTNKCRSNWMFNNQFDFRPTEFRSDDGYRFNERAF